MNQSMRIRRVRSGAARGAVSLSETAAVASPGRQFVSPIPADVLRNALQSAGIEDEGPIRRVFADDRIRLLKVSARTYLGLARGRRVAAPLWIDDHLFFFVPQDVTAGALTALISETLPLLYSHFAAETASPSPSSSTAEARA